MVSDSDARLVTALLPVAPLPFEYLVRQLHHFGCNQVRPRIDEAKSGRSFLGGNFGWSFDGGAE